MGSIKIFKPLSPFSVSLINLRSTDKFSSEPGAAGSGGNYANHGSFDYAKAENVLRMTCGLKREI